MTEQIQNIIAIVIGSLLASIPGILGWALAMKNSRHELPAIVEERRASAGDKIAAGYGKLVDDLQIEVKKLRDDNLQFRLDLDELRTNSKQQAEKILYLENGVRALVQQVKKLNEIPVFDVNGK
jgi:hypothetical protein